VYGVWWSIDAGLCVWSVAVDRRRTVCVECGGRSTQDYVCGVWRSIDAGLCVWSVAVDRHRTVCVECGGRLLRQRLT